MVKFHGFTREERDRMTSPRAGETKLGQTILSEPTEETEYEILGIPESVGVRANHGIGGTETAWPAFLSSFLNMQDNRFLNGQKICLSGWFEVDAMKDASTEVLREYVAEIDQAVSQKVYKIIGDGRIPILIGGGHNNAFGNIKGTSEAYGLPVSVINFDAHADFRALEGRHSGNGFSYARAGGFLGRYSVFGLHKAYVNEYMLRQFDNQKDLQIITFDELMIQTSDEYKQSVKAAVDFAGVYPLGIEIDLDAVSHILSSATTPVGFSIQQLFQFIQIVKRSDHFSYLHITEGAAELYDGRKFVGIGKLIAEIVAEVVMRDI